MTSIKVSVQLRDRINRDARERGVTAAGLIEKLLDGYVSSWRCRDFASGLTDGTRHGPRLRTSRRRVPQPLSAGRLRATLCYMRTVTHREMRNNSGEILRAVAAGETLQVTNNGHLAALISQPGAGSLERLAAQGQARLARRGVSDLGTIRRRAAALTSAELVQDARGRW